MQNATGHDLFSTPSDYSNESDRCKEFDFDELKQEIRFKNK
jgi:hypothetical protein